MRCRSVYRRGVTVGWTSRRPRRSPVSGHDAARRGPRRVSIDVPVTSWTRWRTRSVSRRICVAHAGSVTSTTRRSPSRRIGWTWAATASPTISFHGRTPRRSPALRRRLVAAPPCSERTRPSSDSQRLGQTRTCAIALIASRLDDRAVGDVDDAIRCGRRRDRSGGRDHDLAGGEHLAARPLARWASSSDSTSSRTSTGVEPVRSATRWWTPKPQGEGERALLTLRGVGARRHPVERRGRARRGGGRPSRLHDAGRRSSPRRAPRRGHRHRATAGRT